MGKHFKLKKAINLDKVRKEIYDDVFEVVHKAGTEHSKARTKVVANWSKKSKPYFSSITQGDGDVIRLTFAAQNSEIWNILDKTGAREHYIKPVRAKMLVFQHGGTGSYYPKTEATTPPRYGRKAKLKEPNYTVRSMGIWHPGIVPRKSSESINEVVERRMWRRAASKVKKALKRAFK